MSWSSPDSVAAAVVDFTSDRLSRPEGAPGRWMLSTAGTSAANLGTGLWQAAISDIKRTPVFRGLQKTLRLWAHWCKNCS